MTNRRNNKLDKNRLKKKKKRHKLDEKLKEINVLIK